MSDILIIIPAYNEEDNIERVVDHLIQNFPQYDYVVVNDGSKDRTGEICRMRGYNVLDLPANPERCATAALYHDASEILTGDLPTPIKYYNPEIKEAYKQVEKVSGDRLLTMLPKELQESFSPLIHEADESVHAIVKAADKLSAHIKCIEELKAGNLEFESAAKQTYDALVQMNLPELDWFMAHCLPSFGKNLDELE